jgi:hypothetical protein
MPVAPRAKGKAQKIAFKILGKPANLSFKRSPQQEYVNELLISQESSRVK